MSMHVLVDGANGQMANLQIAAGRFTYVFLYVRFSFSLPLRMMAGRRRRQGNIERIACWGHILIAKGGGTTNIYK